MNNEREYFIEKHGQCRSLLVTVDLSQTENRRCHFYLFGDQLLWRNFHFPCREIAEPVAAVTELEFCCVSTFGDMSFWTHATIANFTSPEYVCDYIIKETFRLGSLSNFR